MYSDFGASVIRVDKPNQVPIDTLARYSVFVLAINYNY